MMWHKALIDSKWVPDNSKPNIIWGFWAEDLSPYYMDVPQQLRDFLIAAQNAAVDERIKMTDDHTIKLKRRAPMKIISNQSVEIAKLKAQHRELRKKIKEVSKIFLKLSEEKDEQGD